MEWLFGNNPEWLRKQIWNKVSSGVFDCDKYSFEFSKKGNDIIYFKKLSKSRGYISTAIRRTLKDIYEDLYY